jgi:hypothetical protein
LIVGYLLRELVQPLPSGSDNNPERKGIMATKSELAGALMALNSLVEFQNVAITAALEGNTSVRSIADSDERKRLNAEEEMLDARRSDLRRLRQYFENSKKFVLADQLEDAQKELTQAAMLYGHVLKALGKSAKRDPQREAKLGAFLPPPPPKAPEPVRMAPSQPQAPVPAPPPQAKEQETAPKAGLTELKDLLLRQQESCQNGFQKLNEQIGTVQAAQLPKDHADVLKSVTPLELAQILDAGRKAVSATKRVRRWRTYSKPKSAPAQQ